MQSTLSERPNLKKIVDSMFWLFLDKVVRLGVGLVVGAWLARYLAPERYGDYSTAIAFAALFAIVAGLGLRRVVVRELVNHPEERAKILGSTFSLLAVSGSLFWMICTLFAATFYQDDPLFFYLVTIVSMRFVFQAFEPIIHFFEADTALKYTVYATNIAYLISNVIKVTLIILQAELIAFALLYLFDGLLIAFSLVILYHRKGYSIWSWKFSPRIAQQLLRDGAPLIFAGLMVSLNARVDQLMMRSMSSKIETGQYAAAVRMLEVFFFLPTVLKQSLFPNIVKEFSENISAFYHKLEDMLNILYAFSYLIIIALLLFSDVLIYLFFGEAYAASASALKILSILLLFISINVVKNSYLIINNWTQMKLVFSIIAASSNILINLWLIPKYGMLGACYASLFSYGISAYFATWFFPKLHPFSRLMTRALLLKRLRKRLFDT